MSIPIVFLSLCILSEYCFIVGDSVPAPLPKQPKHADVTNALETLLNQHIDSLGTALGLSYPHVRKMEHDKLNGMVAAWLGGEDDVKSPPTWAHLVKALRGIKQNGVADKIESRLQS